MLCYSRVIFSDLRTLTAFVNFSSVAMRPDLAHGRSVW